MADNHENLDLPVIGEDLTDANQSMDIVDGGFEVESGSAEHLVEQFLEDNRDLFAATDKAWRDVATAQEESLSQYMSVAGVGFEAGRASTQANKLKMASNQGKSRPLTNDRKSVLAAKTKGLVSLQTNLIARATHVAYMSEIVPAIQNPDIELTDAVDYAAAAFDNGTFMDTVYSSIKLPYEVSSLALAKTTKIVTPEKFESAGETIANDDSNLSKVYLTAFVTQGIAGKKLEQFITGTPGVIEPFVDRLTEMAEYHAIGLIEFPGFLETMAARMAEPDTAAPLIETVVSSRVDPEVIKGEFIQNAFEKPDEVASTARRELMPLILGMRFVANIVTANYDISSERLVDHLAAHFDQWPELLQSAFNTQVKANTLHARQTLNGILKPFVRKGRLTPRADVNTDGMSVGSGSRAKQGPRSGGKATAAQSPRVTVDAVSDVAPERASREPIKAFATTRSLTGGRVLELHDAGNTAEDVASQPLFADYINDHPDDGRLADALEQFINRLALDPTDSVNTAKLRNSQQYTIQGDKVEGVVQRRFRVFQPRQVPEVLGSQVINRTRIVYDVVKVDGKPCLVFRDVFYRDGNSKSGY